MATRRRPRSGAHDPWAGFGRWEARRAIGGGEAANDMTWRGALALPKIGRGWEAGVALGPWLGLIVVLALRGVVGDGPAELVALGLAVLGIAMAWWVARSIGGWFDEHNARVAVVLRQHSAAADANSPHTFQGLEAAPSASGLEHAVAGLIVGTRSRCTVCGRLADDPVHTDPLPDVGSGFRLRG